MDEGDPRLEALFDLLVRLASGDLSSRANQSPRNDELDAIIAGVNMLAEELLRRERELERIARERQQATKLEALGTLAGGIAHDFNNILTSILGNAELGMIALADERRAQQALSEIQNSAERAAGLVQQILAFCRQEPIHLAPLDLSRTVENALKIVRSSLPANVELRQHLLDHCPAIDGNADQITQVVLNLCTNAWQAMPNRSGMIEVSLASVTPSASPGNGRNGIQTHAAARGKPRGDQLLLRVSDDGSGIDEHVQRSMFDPFFTTRKPGKGTGLGLAVVLGIVQKHRGDICVDSQPGRGTCVTISFPVLTGKVAPPPQPSAAPLHSKRCPIG